VDIQNLNSIGILTLISLYLSSSHNNKLIFKESDWCTESSLTHHGHIIVYKVLIKLEGALQDNVLYEPSNHVDTATLSLTR
jgi:hypothetical protein